MATQGRHYHTCDGLNLCLLRFSEVPNVFVFFLFNLDTEISYEIVVIPWGIKWLLCPT